MTTNSYQKIKEFSTIFGVTGDLPGSLVASIFSNNINTYTSNMLRVIIIGYIFKNDPALENKLGELPNAENVVKDMKRIANQTNIMLSTVFQILPLSKVESMAEHCIELLFDIGYNYTGESPENEIPEQIIPIQEDDQLPDPDVPDEIESFLRDILGGDKNND